MISASKVMLIDSEGEKKELLVKMPSAKKASLDLVQVSPSSSDQLFVNYLIMASMCFRKK